MNAAKIIADNARNETEVIHDIIRSMARLTSALIDYSDTKGLGAPVDAQQLPAVVAAAAMTIRGIEIMSDRLGIRAEAHNKAEKSLAKSALKIIKKIESAEAEG